MYSAVSQVHVQSIVYPIYLSGFLLRSLNSFSS